MIPESWISDNTVYSPNEIDCVIDSVKDIVSYCGNKCKYLNAPVSFDIETTSFYDSHNQKTAIMYVWMLGICGKVIMGRTWEEWMYVYNRLVENFRTYGNKRVLIIYVHNLSFDFQFVRKHHKFIKLFANDKYSPLYAQTEEGIEFRCSYMLSGYNLETLAKNLKIHHINKLTGDLDYRQIRHSQTPLTEIEMGYCIHDAKIVCAYIDEMIEREGDITKLPLTKTGFVRNYCRNECFKNPHYKHLISNLTLDADEFQMCKNAFMGGYTHANPEHVNETRNNVTSVDIISSYPSVLVCERFPMSKPKHTTIKTYDELRNICKYYSCIFKITFEGIKPRYWFDFYISASKCEIIGKRTISNGRIVSADYITTTITDVDLDIIQYMYMFDNVAIHECIYFERDYLPTPFIQSLLNLYQKKTELKGIPEYETEYAVIKENLNSFYGMTVTSPVRPINQYINNEWLDPETPDLETSLKGYNTNRNRFLFFPWGVYVTAYARHNIWESIIECGDDHIYTDTDSEKCLHFERHSDFFKSYNERVMRKHENACKVHGLNPEMCKPKTKEGKVKPLGAFEIDGIYDEFKTLGAKRYLYKHGSEYGLTVAGLHKKKGLQYLLKRGDVFEEFSDGLYIPSDYSGRLIHTYIDSIRTGVVVDMYGKPGEYRELSSIHLEPSGYELGVSGEFLRFINRIKEGEYID